MHPLLRDGSDMYKNSFTKEQSWHQENARRAELNQRITVMEMLLELDMKPVQLFSQEYKEVRKG